MGQRELLKVLVTDFNSDKDSKSADEGTSVDENADIPYGTCNHDIWNRGVSLNNKVSTCGTRIKYMMTPGAFQYHQGLGDPEKKVLTPLEACQWVRDLNFDHNGSCDCSCYPVQQGLCDRDIWDQTVTKMGKQATCGARIQWMQTEKAVEKSIFKILSPLTEREACRYVRDEGFDDGTCDCLCFDAVKESDCPSRPKVDKDASIHFLVKDCPSTQDCPVNLWGIPLNCWDMSEVKDLSWAFWKKDVDEPLNLWDVSSVTDMDYMFGESEFNHPIGDWDTSSVKIMGSMFQGSQFNQPIGKWDVSSVTDMSAMFDVSPFNQPIGDWDTSSVGRMDYMFKHSQFNQPIGDWDTSSVKRMSSMFHASEFNQKDILMKWAFPAIDSFENIMHSSALERTFNSWNSN